MNTLTKYCMAYLTFLKDNEYVFDSYDKLMKDLNAGNTALFMKIFPPKINNILFNEDTSNLAFYINENNKLLKLTCRFCCSNPYTPEEKE